MSRDLAVLDAVARDVAEIRTVAEAQQRLAQIQSVQEALRLHRYGVAIQFDAAVIALNVWARYGELVRALPKATGTRGQLRGPGVIGDTRAELPIPDAPTYAAQGINPKHAAQAMAIAAVPPDTLARIVADAHGRPECLRPHRVLQLARTHEPPPPMVVDPDRRLVGSLDTLRERGERFGTIYADPPWRYDNQSTRAATSNHYGTLSVADIAALPIADLAAPDAHLHLWTTNAFLFDARTVLEAWGFEYRSCFVWVKPDLGIGNYWRVSHEFLLLGIRGRAPFHDRGLRSWLECGRGAHSAKPDAVRALVERASAPPRLELFGRRLAPGWTVFGNEIDRSLFDEQAEVVA